jgi:Tfp pilus assembly protein PilP
MSPHVILALAAGTLLGLPGAAMAQDPVPAAVVTPSAGGPAVVTPAVVEPAPPEAAGPLPSTEGYSYVPAGRRDPFVSLLSRGTDSAREPSGTPGRGLAGLRTAEVTLRGTLESRGGYVGLVRGADTRTYVVRAGDRLADGTVQAISPDAMVILQQVNDPLARERQREVRKVLRTSDEARR